jgi:predicted O-methyltransferase YrrM
MFDSMTAEAEVLEFLRTLVTTIKPELVVETGTFSGISTLWIAEGLKANGRGRVITCEYDYEIYENAKARIQASGLADWIELRNASSLDMKVEGTIDLFFSDSDMPIREQEIRRFLPQINPYGLILMHDASSHLKIVRDAALKLERGRTDLRRILAHSRAAWLWHRSAKGESRVRRKGQHRGIAQLTRTTMPHRRRKAETWQ